MGSYTSKQQPANVQEMTEEKSRGLDLVDQLACMDIGGKPASADGSLLLSTIKNWESQASQVGVFVKRAQ